MKRIPAAYRLSEEAVKLIAAAAAARGISKTSVIELAVRKLAKEKK